MMFGNGRNGKNNRNGGHDRDGNGTIIALRGIRKVYDTGAVKVEALRGVDLGVKENEFLAIVGPSGSGKSTLMNIIGCLDTATDGSYRLRGEEVAGLSIDRLAEIRNRRVGFVFQNFNLLPQLTAFENVEMPLLFKGAASRQRRERVELLFEQVGMSDRMLHRPTELSGGQMQRVAIARALACEPDIILADEPTGNLDTTSGRDIVGIFEELWRKGHTLVLITHDPAIARRTRRIVHVQDGAVVSDEAVA
jgi:putative ABC transport system ATP-binding protein